MITRSLAPRAVLLLAAVAFAPGVSATPSTVFRTPATTSTQAVGVPHLTFDTYFGERGALQIDTGLTVGVPTFTRLQMEVGLDLYHPTSSPQGQLGTFDLAQLNGRLTLPEHAFASWMPGFSVGVSHLGFKRDVSNYDLVYATVGESTRFGDFALGMYLGLGSKQLWTTSEGREAHAFMAAWVSPDLRIGAAGLDKIVFMADIATATNWFASEGVAIGLYFTPAIAIKTGPVFFRDRAYYERLGIGSWVWSVHLDVDVDLTRPRGSATEAAHPAPGAAAAPETGPAQTVTPP